MIGYDFCPERRSWKRREYGLHDTPLEWFVLRQVSMFSKLSSTDWYVQLHQQQSFATTTYLLTLMLNRPCSAMPMYSATKPCAELPYFHSIGPLQTYPELESLLTSNSVPTAAMSLGRYRFSILDQSTGHVWIDNVHFFTKQNTKFSPPRALTASMIQLAAQPPLHIKSSLSKKAALGAVRFGTRARRRSLRKRRLALAQPLPPTPARRWPTVQSITGE